MLARRPALHESTLQSPVGDYRSKNPFAFAELLVGVNALLRSGPWVLSGNLQVLMPNPVRMLSCHMIIEHVRDQSFDCINNIVEVYVRHPRIKVHGSEKFEKIRTVRGTDYMIRGKAEP